MSTGLPAAQMEDCIVLLLNVGHEMDPENALLGLEGECPEAEDVLNDPMLRFMDILQRRAAAMV